MRGRRTASCRNTNSYRPQHHSVITSVNNQRVVAARKLQTRKHRQRQGRFLVEGFEILHLALDAGIQPIEVFYCEEQCGEKAIQQLLNRLRKAGATLAPVSTQVLHTLSAAAGNVYAAPHKVPPNVIQTHIVATFALFEVLFQDITLTDDELVLVLDGTQTPKQSRNDSPHCRRRWSCSRFSDPTLRGHLPPKVCKGESRFTVQRPSCRDS